jgi:hypothetical protein
MFDLGSDKLGAAGDVFYEQLVAAHQSLTYEQSVRFNARLILILANHIGDLETLRAALASATGESR